MAVSSVSKTNSRESLNNFSVQSQNFAHLYGDVAWFGFAFGSTLSFLPVFATRLGAAGWQIGLLSAGPALISILFTLPAGRWLAKQELGSSVAKTAFLHRLGYFLLIPLPLLLPASMQVWAVILLTLLMAIPGTALMVGFNALLATTVAPEHRGKVVGRRNALLAATIMVSFVLSGWILDWLPFEWGYVAVFTMGALGGALSTYHLSKIDPPPTPQFLGRPTQDMAQPGRGVGISGSMPHRFTVGLRLIMQWNPSRDSLLSQISPGYWRVMLAFFLFHFTQMLPAALFPMFWVREAQLTDGEIGWVNGIFYLTMLLAAPLLGPLTRRWGNYRLTVVNAILLAAYPLLTALSQNLALLLVTGAIGGVIWAILAGAHANRLLEHIPDETRPAHLAVYNLAFNAALLGGTLLGPFLGDWLGLREALLLVFLLRTGSGLAMARWG